MKHLKRAFAMALCLALCAALSVTCFAQTEATWGDVQQDNFIRFTTADAWNGGTLENLEVTTEVGDGALRLAAGQTDGTWTSAELDVPAFEYMVASWSADTPEGTWVEIKARAYVDMYDQWSGWLSWGKWSPYIKRGSANTTEDLAKVDTDIFTIRGSSGESSSRVQFQFTLHTDDPAITPTLRSVSTTSKNTLEGQAIPVYHPNAGMELPESVMLDTPAYSQMRREPSIGSVICSPTTMTMLLNDRDPSLDLFPEEVALREFDFKYDGYGNWAFTTAIAGTYGYSGYCHYADFDFIKQELACGRSVGLSVYYSNSTSGSYPYLENGAANNTGGHLISIVGYETIDGVEYFYSNDAATNPDSKCAQLRYRRDQLDAAWDGRLAYVLSAQPEAGAGTHTPQRVEAKLEPTDKKDVYQLTMDGEPVKLHKQFNQMEKQMGAGLAFVIADNAKYDTMPEGMKVTTANKVLSYVKANGEGTFYISTGNMVSSGAKTATCYIITNNGPTYVASLELPQPEAPAEPETPAQPETPTQPETELVPPVADEPVAPVDPIDTVEQGGNTGLIIGVVAVVVLAAVAVVFLKKGKKN